MILFLKMVNQEVILGISVDDLSKYFKLCFKKVVDCDTKKEMSFDNLDLLNTQDMIGYLHDDLESETFAGDYEVEMCAEDVLAGCIDDFIYKKDRNIKVGHRISFKGIILSEINSDFKQNRVNYSHEKLEEWLVSLKASRRISNTTDICLYNNQQ